MEIPIKKVDGTFHTDLTEIWSDIKYISEEIEDEKMEDD